MALKHEPALDSLRAVAALSVLLVHADAPGFPGGARGVDVFFVLSGYLITRLLQERAGSYRDFMERRLRRLLPALAAMVALSLPLLALAQPGLAPTLLRDGALALSYTTNLPRMFDVSFGPYFHTWSLAAEMQFYLLWPLIVRRLQGSQRPAAWLVGAWVLITAARHIPGLPREVPYYGLHQSGLLLGAAIAYLPATPVRWGALGAFAVALGVLFRVGDLTLAEIGAALLISSLQNPSALRSTLRWRPLAQLGELSYGIYLWHWPIIFLLSSEPWPVKVGFGLAGSIALAALSFHTVEKRFRRPPSAQAIDRERRHALEIPSQ